MAEDLVTPFAVADHFRTNLSTSVPTSILHYCSAEPTIRAAQPRHARGLSSPSSFTPLLLGLPLYGRCIRVLHVEPIGGAARAIRRTVSAPRCVGCKRVIRIAGIHKIRTRGAQQFFDLLDRLPNHAARLAGLNLAF